MTNLTNVGRGVTNGGSEGRVVSYRDALLVKISMYAATLYIMLTRKI